MGGKALVVAQDGAVAAVTGFAASEFVPLPDDMAAGPAWLPALGHVTAEPMSGGWLLQLHDDAIAAGQHEGTRMVLDLSGAEPLLKVWGPSGPWTQSLSPRHVEILLSLVRHREGRSAAELAADLFADPTRTVTVRAEMSRLRRTLGSLLQHQPYRIAAGVEPLLLLPANVATLMTASSAPIVTEVRAG